MRTFFLILALAVSAFAQKQPVTIFLSGDSTCAPKTDDRRPETGWGEMLGKHFKDGTVVVENRAANGRSTKTFISEGRWQKILDDLKKGDWVFIQFGHNDESKEKGERYSPPDQFRANLIRMVNDVRAKGGNPLFLTPVMRRRFDKDGNFVDQHPAEYPDAFRSLSKELKVPLIDMHRKTEVLIKGYGVEGSKQLFLQLKPGEHPNFPKGVDDNTHYNPKGADEAAALVVEGIREAKLKLRKILK